MADPKGKRKTRVLGDGRYVVRGKLGEGGMAVVYRAHDGRLDTDVVIKIPRPVLLADKEFKERFRREIRSLVTLSHPHIVKIHDVGEHNGVPFVVMQYLSGGSLEDRRKALRTMKSWLPQICSALDFIHSKGYVHRDIKPGNILFDDNGNAYLSDFGIVKAMADAERSAHHDATLTRTGMVVGTPDYMAPEVIMGEAYDGRADQYSLAVMVHELLAGQKPFTGPTPAAVLVKHTSVPPPNLSTVDPQIRACFADAVVRALAKDPNQRFPDCRAFCEALRSPGTADGPGAVPIVGLSDSTEVGTGRTEATSTTQPSHVQGRLLPLTGATARIRHPSGAVLDIVRSVDARLGRIAGEGNTIVYNFLRAGLIAAPFLLIALLLLLWPTTGDRTDVALQDSEGAKADARPAFSAASEERTLAESDTREGEPPVAKDAPGVRLPNAPKVTAEELNRALIDAQLAAQDWKNAPSTNCYRAFAKLGEAMTLCQQVSPQAKKSADELLKMLNGDDGQMEKLAQVGALWVNSDARDNNGVLLVGVVRAVKRNRDLYEAELEVPNTSDPVYVCSDVNPGDIYQVESRIAVLGAIVGDPATNLAGYGGNAQRVVWSTIARQAAWPEAKQPQAAVQGKADDVIETSIGMKLAYIPPGEFLMGSLENERDRDNDEYQHRVRITAAFWLGVTELTQGQWQAVMGTRPWSGQPYVKEGLDYPVTFVSWQDAQAFCQRLSQKEGDTYRLPTEAEWEYACRAGTSTVYHFGDDASRLGDYAWFEYNALDVDEKYKYARRVGQKRPNPFGLYDMHGNVWEWCSDWYGQDYYGNSPPDDPPGPVAGSHRVFRGGGWSSIAGCCRSSDRGRFPPVDRFNHLGFRVARSPSGK